MIHEAILISEKASLNSKSERKGYKVARLTIEKSMWEQRKDIDSEESESSEISKEMLLVREKILEHRANNCNTNPSNFCRKRKENMDQTPSTSKGKVTKRQRLLALDSPRTPSGKPVDPTPSTSTPVSDSSHPVGRSLDERGGKAPPHLPTGMPDTSHPVGGLLDV